MSKVKKIRLDELIKSRNIIEDHLILPMIMAGEVFINGQKATSHAQMVEENTSVEIKSIHNKFVSRGGLKLEEALLQFNIDVSGKICADFGASTGGFTDCLLQYGAEKVYAIETGEKLLADKVRNDERVINKEGVSLFQLEKSIFNNDKIDLVVIDLSFVPLKRALNKIYDLTDKAPIIALVKPHYEAQDESLLRNGVVKDDETRENILNEFKIWLQENNYTLKNIIESPIKGGGGNVEFLVYIISE